MSKLITGLPKEIRVLGKTYKVSYVDRIDGDAYGINYYDKQEIHVATMGMSRESLEETLLHEVIHCIENAMKLEMSEQQVHALSEGLYAMFKDNGFWWEID